MVWKIFTGVDNQVRITNWRNIHFKKEINGLGRADIEIFDVKPHQRADSFQISHLVKSVIEIFDGSTLVFSGFIDDVEVSEPNTVRVLCVAYEILLFDELIEERDYQTGTVDVAVAVKGVLDTYSTKVGYRSDEITTASVNITKEYSYDNLFKAIHDLTFLGGQEFWVRRYGTDFRLHTANERGNGSATNPVATFNTAFDTLNNIDRKRLSESVNKITVTGKGDGINMITRTVPGDAAHALATAAQTKYGVIHEVVRDQSIDNNTDAETLATKILDKIHEPVNKIKLNRSRHNPRVDLGDYVQIKNSKQGVDIVKRVKRITANISISGLPDVTYEFVEKDDGIDGVITEIRRQELTARVHQQGATNIIQVPMYENADTSEPAMLRFRVPSEAKNINAVKLNFKMKPYRTYEPDTGDDTQTIASGVSINNVQAQSGAGITNVQAQSGAGITNVQAQSGASITNVGAGGSSSITDSSAGNVSRVLNETTWVDGATGTHSSSDTAWTLFHISVDGIETSANKLLYIRVETDLPGDEKFPTSTGFVMSYGDFDTSCTIIIPKNMNGKEWLIQFKAGAGNTDTIVYNWQYQSVAEHTHSNTFNDANHTNSNTFNDANHTNSNTFDDANHTNSNTLSDANHKHTTTSTFSIFESALSSPNLTVKISTYGNEGSPTTIATYGSNQDDIDLTSYVTANNTWYTVHLLPDQLMRIEANLYAQFYIESK